MSRVPSIKSTKLFRSARYTPTIDKGFLHLKLVHHTHLCFGMIVTRKIGGAVDRNRIKRRIRHAFQLAASQLRQHPKYAVVIFAKRDCLTVEFEKLVGSFVGVLGG